MNYNSLAYETLYPVRNDDFLNKETIIAFTNRQLVLRLSMFRA
jgi:hypothetical protein